MMPHGVLAVAGAVGVCAAVLTACGDGRGVPGDIIFVEADDPEMVAAQREARETWDQAFMTFSDADGTLTLAAKFPFATPDGGAEFMWIIVEDFHGDEVTGILNNDPRDVPGMRAGDAVTAPIGALNDWLLSDDSGVVDGGFTIDVLKDR